MATCLSTHARLQADQNNINDVRNLTLCKVCLRPFYEPFILVCGHTFCYGCLRSWFCGDSTRRVKKKNCPECRTIIKTTPVPNYSIRDLAHIFFDRPELLPEDETEAEHNKGKLEEAQLLATDRHGEGLFKGVFKPLENTIGGRAIHDAEDDVDRCPICSWELEEGMCNHCGWEDPEQEFSDFDGDSVADMDSEDDPVARQDRIDPLWPHHFHVPLGTGESSAEEDQYGTPRQYDDYDEVDDDDDMGDFISDDEDRPNEIDYHDYRWNRPRTGRSHYHGVEEDTNQFPELTSEYTDTTHGDDTIPFSPIDSDEQEDEEEQEITGRVRRNPRILSDEEDVEEGESILPGSYPDNDPTTNRSPTTPSVEDDDQHTTYDESDSEPQLISRLWANRPIIKRRTHQVISDDDDEDEQEDHSQGQGEDQHESEDDSDEQAHDIASNTMGESDEELQAEDSDVSDDSSPPQPTARRMQRLNVHQAARVRRSTSNEQRPNHNSSGQDLPYNRSAQRTGPTSTTSRNTGRSLRTAARVH